MHLSDPGLLETRAFIGGEWRERAKRFFVLNPAHGDKIAEVADCTRADAREAIKRAKDAQPAWAAHTSGQRAALLRRWYELIIENVDDLAMILTTEMGKPLSEARNEIIHGAAYIQWFAEEAKRIYGETIPAHQPDKRLLVFRQPVGVVAAITPWNFPSAMITRKLAPALAAGCTIIVKPATETPLSALALALLAERAGMPAGTLSILPSSDAVALGLEFCENPSIRKISFTGSTRVGRILMRQSADGLKKLAFELGGNAPFIIFDDADISSAIDGCVASKFRNAGQTCVSPNRIYAQSGIHDAFLAGLLEIISKLETGPGDNEAVDIGPLISHDAVNRIEAHIADALAQGAKLLSGGARLHGTFFPPTILSDVTDSMSITKEEIFGPVAPVFRFETEAEVVAAANATEAGLASYVYTRDLSRAWRMMEALDYGMVGVNSAMLSTERAPFGGMKQSGFGREGSRHGLLDYLELKYACVTI